jgi:hypothetical protein
MSGTINMDHAYWKDGNGLHEQDSYQGDNYGQ